jgi:hypothetical protein
MSLARVNAASASAMIARLHIRAFSLAATMPFPVTHMATALSAIFNF